MYQGRMGHKTVNYTGTQSFTTMLSYALAKNTFGTIYFGFVASKIVVTLFSINKLILQNLECIDLSLKFYL